MREREPIETASDSELRALQLERLRCTLTRAYQRVPHYGAEALGCTVIPASGGFTERQVQLIADFSPDIIAATPSYLLAVADELARKGIGKTSLRLALCGAEPWGEGMRAEIEWRLGVKA